MSANSTKFWKHLWQWTTSGNLNETEFSAIFDSKEVIESLKLGLLSYKPLKHNSFSELQSKYPDQTKLLSITQTLQNYIDVDTFQTWDIIKNYLCDISYGTPANALKNVAFVDTRPSFLLPSIWKFYHAERLFLLKLLLYLVEYKDDPCHAYQVRFHKIVTNIGLQGLKASLIDQFEKLLTAAPPPRKIHKEFSSDTARQEWAEANLREQLVVLQILLLIVSENSISDTEFKKLFKLFKKHSFGKNQSFNDLLEERHRENCTKIMHMEISLFLIINNQQKISNVTSWLDNTKQIVEAELTKLQLSEEHGPMLLSWMLLTLKSKEYLKQFESQYQHYGATALRLSVFEYLHQMLKGSIFSDNSKCSFIVRQQVFSMLNEMCDKFDGDGTIGHENGAMELAAHLLQSPDIARQFWNLHSKEENCGIVSLWNTALEFFPFNFRSLSIMAAGLAQAGKCNIQILLEELKNLPVYSELYNPNLVPVTKLSMNCDDVVVGRDYYPFSSQIYKVEAGSRAALIDRKDGTWIHYRTPYSYWTIFSDVIERALGHHQTNLNGILQRVYEGTTLLIEVMKVLVKNKEVPKYLMGPCEGVFAILIRYMRAESPPLPLLVSCLNVSNALVPLFHKEIHLRLINTGLLPRLVRAQLSPAEYAIGTSLEPGAAGSYLVTLEQPTGMYNFLAAYIDLLCGFCQDVDTFQTWDIIKNYLCDISYGTPANALKNVAFVDTRPSFLLPSIWKFYHAERLFLLKLLLYLVEYKDDPCHAYQVSQDDRVLFEIVLPGLVFVLREVFPNVCGWRYSAYPDRRQLLQRCINVLFYTLQHPKVTTETALLVQKTCVYALLHTENALELLKIVAVGNTQLELMMYDESNWISGSGSEYLKTVQKAFSVLMLALKLKTMVNNSNEITPIEHLIFAQNKQKDALKVVPRVTSYINHAFNKNLSILCCKLLTRFASEFQMSLFSCLDMTAYQVRVMFLDRLQDKYENQELKISILEFVAACVGKQPGLTEAFFNMKHMTKTEKDDKDDKTKSQDDNDEGILMYMAEYLGTVNVDVALLHSPLLGCIMALFHALWKNNMQILVKELRDSSNFWEQLTSPLFNDIQPGLRSYAQIFNVLGIELFISRGKIDPSLKKMLEMFFDTDKKYLNEWITFIYSFEGRMDEDEPIDRVPVWLGLLTSWKDFTTIFCKCLPISLNIAHKAKMVKPCLTTLLQELKNLRDSRLVVILAELYVIMLANWKDDCFENRKAVAVEIGGMLSNTATVYECLHPRAKRAILAIGTVAISSLDYEIKANSAVAQSIIIAVTDINSFELEKLFDNINDVTKSESTVNGGGGRNENEDIAPIVLSLAMLEQCLELYDAMFTGLDQWFKSTMFINKILCCLQSCLQNRKHYHTSLAALRCLITYSRGPFSKDLLICDVDQFLWLQLLPPKFDTSDSKPSWKPAEWWKVYAHSMDFISMMIMNHGQFFANSAITFVGVHLEHLVEAILMPGLVVNMDSLNLCAATLNLVLQLMKYESQWRTENLNSLTTIMRSISTCLCQCVILALRARRPDVVAAPAAPSTPAHDDSSSAVATLQHTPTLLNRILELLHMASLCLCAWSPPLLTLLADPTPVCGPLLVELHFGAPKISYETATGPELSFGTLLAAVCLLTKTLNHSYHAEESSGSRSPRARRRACSCGSPGGGGGRSARSESVTSLSSGTSAAAGLWPLLNERLLAGALDASLALLASQALVVVRNPHVATRHKQLVRRELSSELTVYHDFVRKRVLCATHARPHLLRHKLGTRPLSQDENEARKLEMVRDFTSSSSDDDTKLPPPPPPKRPAHDSMREYILRKHYLDKCAHTPIKDPPSPVSHSTPTSERKSSKRVSWAESARDPDQPGSPTDNATLYSPLTDVHVNNDEDYFHFMSLVFLYICQNDL